MNAESTRAVFTTLRDRLQQAEQNLRRALSAADNAHPVAEPARDLLAIHTEIRDLLLANFEPPVPGAGSGDEPEVDTAAIQIQREEHTLKPDFMDVVKALFMWRDDPVERVQKDPQ